MKPDLSFLVISYRSFVAAIILILFSSVPIQSATGPDKGPWLTIPEKENPHGDLNNCIACHQGNNDPAKENFFQSSCAECHEAEAHRRAIHLTEFPVDNKDVPISTDLPLYDGKVECITCHGMSCRIERSNREMLRGAPYSKEMEFCYSCHKKENYAALNPHEQEASKKKYPRTEKPDLKTRPEYLCLSCHKEASQDSRGKLHVGDLINTDTHILCHSCHEDVGHESQHIGHSMSENEIQQDTAALMANFEKSSGIKLPLDPDSKISCSTCHVPNNACTMKNTTGNKDYLRVPREQICHVCHNL
jgi:hypothetical protein